MRRIISILLLVIVAFGISLSLAKIPFGVPKTKVGRHYINEGVKETGATNIVTSVVLSYRGFDTLGEVTVLFIASIGFNRLQSSISSYPRFRQLYFHSRSPYPRRGLSGRCDYRFRIPFNLLRLQAKKNKCKSIYEYGIAWRTVFCSGRSDWLDCRRLFFDEFSSQRNPESSF